MKKMYRKINPQEVWSAWVKYEDKPNEGKYRPVIAMAVNNDVTEVLSVPITSTEPRDEFDIEIFDWEEIPLDNLSTARISKALEIPIYDFRKRLGKLADDDWDNITDLYVEYLKSIGEL